MDGERFDLLARRLALAASRRGFLRGALGGVLGSLGGAALAAREADAAAVLRRPGELCRKSGECVANAACVIDATGRGRCACAGQFKPCNGACIPSANCCTAADCPDDGNPCTGVACTAGACTYPVKAGAPCDDGNACTDNSVCQADGTCRGTSNCLTGQACVCGACYSVAGAPCTADEQCTTEFCVDGACVKGHKAIPCAFDSDCYTNNCQQVSCSGAEFGACYPAPAGGPCGFDDDDCTTFSCGDDGICRQSHWTLPCESDADCYTNICQNGACEKAIAGGPCGLDDDDCTTNNCGANGICGQSHKALPCAVNADCYTNICNNGACDPANAGGPCGFDDDDCITNNCGADGVCLKSHWTLPCAVNADCYTDICLNGACEKAPAGGPCGLDDDCTTNNCSANGICQ